MLVVRQCISDLSSVTLNDISQSRQPRSALLAHHKGELYSKPRGANGITAHQSSSALSSSSSANPMSPEPDFSKSLPSALRRSPNTERTPGLLKGDEGKRVHAL